MSKKYGQYCPVARALELVGERWALLIVRDLMEHGPQRYSDLLSRLEHCGTNILAGRLKDLERAGIVQRRKLPPPAASTVYELTHYGLALRSVLHELAHWGARSLGPPPQGVELDQGWLPGALRIALSPRVPAPPVEFRIGGEVACIEDGVVHERPAQSPVAVVEGDPAGFYHLLVDRDVDAVSLVGDRAALEELLAALPAPCPEPALADASEAAAAA